MILDSTRVDPGQIKVIRVIPHPRQIINQKSRSNSRRKTWFPGSIQEYEETFQEEDDTMVDVKDLLFTSARKDEKEARKSLGKV